MMSRLGGLAPHAPNLRRCLCRCVAAVVLSCAAAAAAEPPVAPRLDFIPAQWRELSVQWKATWEETLEANLAPLRSAAAAAKPDQPAAGVVAAVRQIELYRALIDHFPQRSDQHAQAYLAMADICRTIRLPQAGAYYAWKVTREHRNQPDLLARAYLLLAQCTAGMDSEAQEDWTASLYETLDLAERGGIPAGHPAVAAACEGIRRDLCGQMRYDKFAGALERFGKLARGDARIYQTIVAMLEHFGEDELAASLLPQKDQGGWNDPVRPTAGELPRLGGHRELETRWDAFMRGAKGPDASARVDADQVQRIIDLAVKNDAHAAISDAHHVSYWALAMTALEALPPASLAPLREHQGNAAPRLALAMDGADDPAAVARLTRLYPYAAGVHEALAELGEKALRESRFAAATAAFSEVVRHSSDASLSARARIGLCLALEAQSAPDEAIAAVLEAMPDTAEIPWRGGRATAGRLKSEQARPSAGSLSALPRLTIALPADWPLAQRHTEGPFRNHGLHAPWPVVRIERWGRSCFVSGPGRVACLPEGSAVPRWQIGTGQAAAAGPAHAAAQYMQHPWRDIYRRPLASGCAGSRAVAEDGSRLYLLSTATGAVSAVDLRSGKELWSTAGRDEWRNLAAMNYPAAADGRVYVLAVPSDGPSRPAAAMTSKGPWHLVCLDGRDGSLLWKTPISWAARGELDLARDAAPVTVDGAAVYCCPGMGLVARCDARDGRLIWVRGYPSAAAKASTADALVYSREGTEPIVAGERLFVAPRDSSGVMALRADNGEPLWSAAMIPSDRMVGVSGSALVTLSGPWLAALDVASGRQIWLRHFPDAAPVQAAMNGPDLTVLAGRRLHRISAHTGKTLEDELLGGDANDQYALLDEGTLAQVLLPPPAEQPPATLATALALPLSRAAYIAADQPALVVPAQSGEADKGFCVLSASRLLRVQTQPQLKIAWHRTLARRPLAAHVVGGRVLLSTDRRLAAVDLAGGTDLWTLQVPLVPYAVGGNDSLLLALPGSHGSARLAAIDPAAGKLLWTRSLTAGARFRGGIYRVELHGQGTLRSLQVVLQTLFDGGWKAGLVTLDAAGAVTAVEPFVPPAQEGLWFSGRALVNASADPAVRIARPGQPAAGAVYELPAPEAPGIHEVLACRRSGAHLWVVSALAAREREKARVYVDQFDIASRRHLGRQGLEGVAYCTGGQSGYDTHAQILDRAIVVTDAGGVHVFAAAK